MKAMIFAAGVGSRLREFTRDTPKCLMQVGDRTILEHVIVRLREVGVTAVAINVHHQAEKVVEFVTSKNNFGIEVVFSHEPSLLDTGGGLKKAASFFSDQQSFLIHNADVFSDIDLKALLESHHSRGALGTLAVMERSTKRGLYFDKNQHLVGWSEEPESIPQGSHMYGFCGISVASSEIFSFMGPRAVFSLIEPFLAAASATRRVWGYILTKDREWVDIGTPEHLRALQDRLKSRTHPAGDK